METIKRYWKQSAGLVIDFRSKYLSDIFFRTELNVVILQIVFAITLSVIVSIAFNYLYRDVLSTLIAGINESIRGGNIITGEEILNSIQIIKAQNFLGFFTLTMVMTLVFGYVIAKITLFPARQSLESQKRFVGDIAHELRTPLSVIKTNNEVALMDSNLSERTKKVFRDTVSELDRASAIINNLLTFSNLIHPEQINFGLVSIGKVVDTSVNKLDELIKKKEIKLSIKKTLPDTILGNVTAMEQVVMNVLKNAINYNRKGGSVDISVGPDYRGNIVLAIEDTGVGISEDDIRNIFEPFYRAERSRNRQSGSTGLGLTIVSEIVKLHSGRINVKSKLKHGTVVTIVLKYNNGTPFNTRKDDGVEEDGITVDFLKRKRK